MSLSKTLVAMAVAAMAAARWAASGQSGPVQKLQPQLDELVAPDSQLERIATGFKWTEGPIWINNGFLLFAEIPSNSIRKWTPDGQVTLFMQPSGYEGSAPYGGPEPGSNGMTLDKRGRLTVAGHARRSVWRLERMDKNGPITVLAENYQGKQLNSPNDVVYKSDGSLYFTDPPYGFRTQSDQDPHKELRVNGVYRIRGALQHTAGAVPEPNKLDLLISDLPRPNGIAFSPDEKYLYVSNSEPKKIWMRYKVNADGTLGTGTLFYDASSESAPGSPDGMKVDTLGNLYSAGPGGVWIFSSDGKHLGTIRTPEKAANVAFGNADGKMLYITASSGLYRMPVKLAGIRP